MDAACTSSVRILAVGDMMLGDHPLSVGRGVDSMICRYGPDHPFLHVRDLLHSADITIGNLEAVLSSHGLDTKNLHSVTMRARPASAKGLARAGFDVLSIANNHILDHGIHSALDTIRHLSESGIGCVGLDEDMRPRHDPLTIECNGLRIGFLAYCLVPTTGASLVRANEEDILTDITRARDRTDVLVVSLHWGDEYIDRPSPSQIRLARRIVDSGAHLIIGHHPHVLQGIEKYKHGIIAYSLGNFVFDMDFIPRTRYGIALDCTVSKHQSVTLNVIPVRINTEHAPTVAVGSDRDMVLRRVAYLSDKLNAEGSATDLDEEGMYFGEVRAVKSRIKKQIIKYFLLNLCRYNPRYSLAIMYGFLTKAGRALR